MGLNTAFGLRVRDRVVDGNVRQLRFPVGIGRDEVMALAVDAALAVAGHHGKQMNFDDASILDRARPLGGAPTGKRLARKWKN